MSTPPTGDAPSTGGREGDSAFSVANNSLAKTKLNWVPKRNLEEMCIDSWNWFKNNPKGL